MGRSTFDRLRVWAIHKLKGVSIVADIRDDGGKA